MRRGHGLWKMCVLCHPKRRNVTKLCEREENNVFGGRVLKEFIMRRAVLPSKRQPPVVEQHVAAVGGKAQHDPSQPPVFSLGGTSWPIPTPAANAVRTGRHHAAHAPRGGRGSAIFSSLSQNWCFRKRWSSWSSWSGHFSTRFHRMELRRGGLTAYTSQGLTVPGQKLRQEACLAGGARGRRQRILSASVRLSTNRTRGPGGASRGTRTCSGGEI